MNEKYGGGLLLRNFRKSTPKQPDFTGNELDFCCPQCKAKMKIAAAAWEKTGTRGKFFSLALSEPYVRPNDQAAPQSDSAPSGESAPPQSETRPPTDDDIPF